MHIFKKFWRIYTGRRWFVVVQCAPMFKLLSALPDGVTIECEISNRGFSDFLHTYYCDFLTNVHCIGREVCSLVAIFCTYSTDSVFCRQLLLLLLLLYLQCRLSASFTCCHSSCTCVCDQCLLKVSNILINSCRNYFHAFPTSVIANTAIDMLFILYNLTYVVFHYSINEVGELM